MRLTPFNLPLSEKINLKKERVGIRRIKIIIVHNPRKTKHNFLMKRISINLDILALFVVTITTRRIVQDASRSLSSFKGPENLLHLSFCLSPSLLNSRPNWSSMTNILLPPLHMSLCVLVILRRTTLPSPLGPKIILLPRRKLTIYHYHWFNRLLQFHLPTILFISNDRAPIQFSAPSQGSCSKVYL
jgi:hypothetical protein